MKEILTKLTRGQDLTADEAENAMKTIMGGQATDAQIGAFLAALAAKGETSTEIAALAKIMRQYAVKITPNVKGTIVDICGTGGDAKNTFNISTAAMFLVAAAGIPVAKHGNRSITSKSGSADALEALGVMLETDPEKIGACIEEVGIGFMFAPHYHPAMKNVMPARKQLGIRTVFNILGPLTNPADAKGQLMGVFDPKLTETLAEVFRQLGLKRALVVNGDPGIDEISTVGPTKISELRDGKIKTYQFDAKEFGIKKAELKDLTAADAKENAKIIRDILSGKVEGPKKDIVVLNAAAGIIAGEKADDFKTAIKIAEKQIVSGAALKKLEQLIEYTNR